MPRTWTVADDNDTTDEWSSDRYIGQRLVSDAIIDEYPKGGMIETRITLNRARVSLTSTAAGVGIGGKALYRFPQEHLRLAGAVADLTWEVDAASQINTIADLGTTASVGTAVPDDADALGADAADDDLGQTVLNADAVAFTGTSSINSAISSLAPVNTSPPNDPAEICFNMAINSLDIVDDTTVVVLVSGTITVAWMGLGAN